MDMEQEHGRKASEYTGILIKKYELLDAVMQCIREENEYGALASMAERNELPAVDILRDELLLRQYDSVQIKALLEQTVRRMGVRELFLNSINTEFLYRISKAKSIEECKRINIDMVHRYCGLVTLNENKKYSILVQQIVYTVDVDLSQSLTLQYFADFLNVNKCYLSDLFRKETGKTITEYVTDRRISRAADMLLMTQQSVRMIGEQVGIQDVHYFSRLFKKHMGVTPSQYREQGLKQGNEKAASENYSGKPLLR